MWHSVWVCHFRFMRHQVRPQHERLYVCMYYLLHVPGNEGTHIRQLPVASRQALQCLFICVYSTLNCAIKARLLLFQLCESHWIHSARVSGRRTHSPEPRTQNTAHGPQDPGVSKITI